MVSYTTIRILMGFAAIFVLVFMLNGLPCLGDANAANNRINSIRIFQDNRELLKTSQNINLGQSLVVPKLPDSEFDKVKIWGIFPNSMFEIVESVGRRHLSDDGSQSQAGLYIVRDGDTLWNIAAEQLGNASRYKEIAQLNADVIKNENKLTIGMRLSLPDRE
jgi:hypothetical protein